jgi:hypothetical protein
MKSVNRHLYSGSSISNFDWFKTMLNKDIHGFSRSLQVNSMTVSQNGSQSHLSKSVHIQYSWTSYYRIRCYTAELMVIYTTCRTMYISRGSSGSVVSTMDWTTGRPGFDPRQRQKDFFCSLFIQISYNAHPASCPKGTGDLSAGLKRGRGVTLTIHLHLVPRSRMRGAILVHPLPSLRLHGV